MTPTTAPPLGRVLIIAGSDSGGGAGIQADIKTVAALGGFPATAVTALTAQNTHGVRDILPTPPGFVADQMCAVLDDIGADCIKTGMLSGAGVIESVCEVLAASADSVPLVVDPVMVASSGDSLMEGSARDCLIERLIPRADLCTPNMPEAALISGHPVNDFDQMRRAAENIIGMGARAVLVKGGHGGQPVIQDLLLTSGGEILFEDRRIDSKNTHGTGCTLASAVAAGLAKGTGLEKAVAEARRFVRAAIRNGPDIGGGDNRPLGHPRFYSQDGDASG